MTESAANALLKTLEEPNAYSHIILLTTEIERLIPTIISRCRHIALRATKQTLKGNANGDTATTFAGFASEENSVDAVQYNEFTTLFYQFIAEPSSRSKILTFMQAQPLSLSWCELAIVDLMRFNNNWLNVSPDTVIEEQALARLRQLTQDDIWQLHTLISACKSRY